ncbi:MAG: hypothetical protein LBI94_07835 [Treponema sp.]|jgi:hypothetical protein|nr:hypothetical protein [Treponema sp.]
MKFSRSRQFRLPRLGRLAVRAGLPLLVLAAAGVFFYRPPVLFVSDTGFDALYGFRRGLTEQIYLSLRLFRRVERVTIAENANPEALVFAIEEKETRPGAVLGPVRYSRGLERYARQRPDVRVTVIGQGPGSSDGLNRLPPGEGGPDFVFPDAPLNSWRAGRCAALLAGDAGGIVLVFQENRDFPVHREAFLAGLQEENKNLVPVYLELSSSYSSWGQVRCVVLGGAAEAYLNRDNEVPSLLYSWMDSALTPSKVKVIGDDSPWALAYRALRTFPAGETSVPARFRIPPGRVGDSGLREKLKKAFNSPAPPGFFW